MRRTKFLSIVLVARILRYFGLAFLGARMGHSPAHYLKSHGLQLAGIATAVFLLLYGAIRLKDYLRRRAHHHQHLHPHAD